MCPEILGTPLSVRVSVNHDGRGGTALDALVWDQGGLKKRRKIQVRVNVDLATLPGPPGFLQGSWMQVSGGCHWC